MRNCVCSSFESRLQVFSRRSLIFKIAHLICISSFDETCLEFFRSSLLAAVNYRLLFFGKSDFVVVVSGLDSFCVHNLIVVNPLLFSDNRSWFLGKSWLHIKRSCFFNNAILLAFLFQSNNMAWFLRVLRRNAWRLLRIWNHLLTRPSLLLQRLRANATVKIVKEILSFFGNPIWFARLLLRSLLDTLKGRRIIFNNGLFFNLNDLFRFFFRLWLDKFEISIIWSK